MSKYTVYFKIIISNILRRVKSAYIISIKYMCTYVYHIC